MKIADSADLATVYLHPAELCVCDEPTKVITVLGSCVTLTMFNARTSTGAICHATLPRCRSMGACESVCVEAFKFMDCAFKFMLGSMRERGILNEEIQVKMFGGADTMRSKSSNTIGSKNVRQALYLLKQERLRVVAADVGDSFGRKLIFFSHTGEVYLKRLKNGMMGGRNGQ